MPRREHTADQMMALLTLAQRIRRVRRHYKLSQAAFAKALGVSRSHLSEVERQKAKPAVEMVLGIRVAFPEVRADWLLVGEGPMLGGGASETKEHEPADLLAIDFIVDFLDDLLSTWASRLKRRERTEFTVLMWHVLRSAYAAARHNPTVSIEEAWAHAQSRARRVAKDILSP